MRLPDPGVVGVCRPGGMESRGPAPGSTADSTAGTEAVGITASQRHDTRVRYFTSKHQYLCYDQALPAGWPIATGGIEGACRHLTGDRLDIGGATWGDRRRRSRPHPAPW